MYIYIHSVGVLVKIQKSLYDEFSFSLNLTMSTMSMKDNRHIYI